jgi:hypothetical protein
MPFPDVDFISDRGGRLDYRPLEETGRWKLSRAEIGLAVTLLSSMFFYEYIPFWFIRLAGFLVRTPQAYPVYQFLQALICFSVMFIPSLCLGMTLPLVSRIATAELARTGRSVGSVFSIALQAQSWALL